MCQVTYTVFYTGYVVLWDFIKSAVVRGEVGCIRSRSPLFNLIYLGILIMKGSCFMYGHRKKGRKMGRGQSRKMFSGVAQWIHPMNVHSDSMRGGFRL